MVRELEITNFRGISHRSTPDKNECDVCTNLDLRGNEGELTIRQGFTVAFATNPVPTITDYPNFTVSENLAFEKLYLSQFATPQEVTLYLQKGRIARRGTVATYGGNAYIDVVGIFARPFYVSGSWSDAWKCLNQIALTHITVRADYTITVYGATLGEFNDGVIYNVTRGQFAKICSQQSFGGLAYEVANICTTWLANDVVILMEDYFPITYAAGNYSATRNLLSFHKVLNDFRIGFGGYVNRLGIGIGYRNKTFFVKTATATSFVIGSDNIISRIILDPYNIVTDTGTYNLTITNTEITGELGFTVSKYGNTIFYKVTALLDDFNEYQVLDGSFQNYNSSNGKHAANFNFYPTIRYATMNKRITALKFYLAKGTDVANERGGDYLLCKTAYLTHITGTNPNSKYIDSLFLEETWKLSSAETLVFQEIFDGVVSKDGYFQITPAMFDYATKEISSTIGYAPTSDYVKSWDRAVVTGGRTHFVNPYTSDRQVNKIFISAISGNSSFQYDVATANTYYDLESRDGNDLVTLEVMPNMDLIAVKQNSSQIIDSSTGIVIDLGISIGGESARGVVNFGEQIAVASKYGIYELGRAVQKNITKGSIDDIYKAIATKSNIFAIKEEKERSLRFSALDGNEYIYTSGKGFVKITNSPYTNLWYTFSQDGYVYTMIHTGNIYKIDDTIPNTSFEWQSILFDVGKMGEGIKANERLYLYSYWLEYTAHSNFYFNISLDGSLIYGATELVIPSTETFFARRFPLRKNRLTRNFKIKLTGSTTTADTTRFTLKGIGLLYRVRKIPVGRSL